MCGCHACCDDLCPEHKKRRFEFQTLHKRAAKKYQNKGSNENMVFVQYVLKLGHYGCCGSFSKRRALVKSLSIGIAVEVDGHHQLLHINQARRSHHL
jgi:hypothetical protein